MQWSNSTHMLCTNYCSHYTTIQIGVSSPRWVVNRRLLAKDGKCATKKLIGFISINFGKTMFEFFFFFKPLIFALFFLL